MRCNKCKSKNTKVICTEHKNWDGKQLTFRYIRCLDCKNKFKTKEEYAPSQPRHTPTCKVLDEEIVRTIRENKEGLSDEDYAIRYYVQPITIERARTGKSWKHVT